MGIPYVLSTMGTTSPEDVAAAAPNGQNWFQLYLWRDRGASLALVERARTAGFGALMLTVDTPVAGARLRDVAQRFHDPACADRQDAASTSRSIPAGGSTCSRPSR